MLNILFRTGHLFTRLTTKLVITRSRKILQLMRSLRRMNLSAAGATNTTIRCAKSERNKALEKFLSSAKLSRKRGIRMIKIMMNKYNSPASNKIFLAMTEAKMFLIDSCEIDNPGYAEYCHDCPGKQGCRDITRAANYCQVEYYKKVGVNIV